jgi:hypothetical protein
MTVIAYDHITHPFSVNEVSLLPERVASYLKLKSGNRMLREKLRPCKNPVASPALSKCRGSTASSREQLTASTRF